MAGLVLAGGASVGKTTLARRLSRLDGYRYHEVEARECWGLTGTLRQLCFAERFASSISLATKDLLRGKRIVLDNSMLSVIAYTEALMKHSKEGYELAPLAISYARSVFEELEYRLHGMGLLRIVVITAPPSGIKERIAARMRREKDRATNVVETEITLHVEAQERLIHYAKKYGLPIVENDREAMEAYRIVKRIGYESRRVVALAAAPARLP